MTNQDPEKLELIERLDWLIKLRWIAIIGVFITVWVSASELLGDDVVLPKPGPLYVVGIVMALYNLGFTLHFMVLNGDSLASIRGQATLQIVLDLFALTFLIHFAGGVENPFFFYFVFHMIIASILLSPMVSYLLAALVTVLLGSIFLLECRGVIRHHDLGLFAQIEASSGADGSTDLWRNNVYIIGVFFAFVTTVFFSVYFATTIMERFRARGQEIAYQRNRLGSVIDNMTEGVIFADADGIVSLCNEAAERMKGVNSDEIMGRPILDCTPPRDREEIENLMRAFRSGRTEAYRVETPGADNGFSYDAYSPVLDTEGKYVGMVLVSEDITDRKRFEEERKQFEAQIFKQEKLAVLGQLAASVAHELNSPLGAILVYSQMLEQAVTGGEDNSIVKKIEAQTQRCKKIIQDLVDLSGEPGTERSLQDINAVIRKVSAVVEGDLTSRDVRLILSLSEDAPRIMAAENQIEQVIFHLINNAADAMPRGGEIALTTLNGEQDDLVEIQISDNGSGMEQDELNHIFDSFYTTKEPREGRGLGLSVVKKIIEDHDGKIAVESESKKGTTFKICLPRQQRITSEC